jgi:fused signal recognition particle receptor
MQFLATWLGSEAAAWAFVVAVAVAAAALAAWWVRRAQGRALPAEPGAAGAPGEEPEAKPRAGLALQLGKAREGILGRIQAALAGGTSAEVFAQLEEVLVTSDFGLETTEALLQRVKAQGATSAEGVRRALREAVLEVFAGAARVPALDAKPAVVMVLGVNGVGKTTSIGKLATRFARDGKKVVLAAGDTFRAAAIEQLEIWAQRAGADIVKGQPEGDPAAVCFDAVKAAQARGADLVLCDTAGRLHTKSNLMEELKKVRRVIAKAMPEAPHEVWLVLDATTGQNALQQAKQFHAVVPLTGVVMTKLDGTAKGGILVAVARELRVPVLFIGVGEGAEDLRPFDPAAYVDAVLGEA